MTKSRLALIPTVAVVSRFNNVKAGRRTRDRFSVALPILTGLWSAPKDRPRLARAGSQHPFALLIWREQRCKPSYSHLIPDEEMDFTRLPFSYSFPAIRWIRQDQSPPHPSDCARLHSSIARSYAPSRSSIVLARR